jgi:predicted RNA-binding Zn ribbon-like protein
MNQVHAEAVTAAPQVGDHLALDLLNTQARADGHVKEFWNTADDVRNWLARQGIVAQGNGAAAEGATLLAQAIELRELARDLLTLRKDGQTPDPAGLNVYLDACLSAPHLERDDRGKMNLVRQARGDALATLLGPLAESVAQLLADGDFSLVKQCEHPDCVLWFYDRTKAHKRRWCSMALCGNRYKAAQFRKKAQGS